jgi:hypothetical protein
MCEYKYLHDCMVKLDDVASASHVVSSFSINWCGHAFLFYTLKPFLVVYRMELENARVTDRLLRKLFYGMMCQRMLGAEFFPSVILESWTTRAPPRESVGVSP